MARLKFNPGVRGDEELVREFVVRENELETAVRLLRENAASDDAPNQHLLFVGPRGAGKTMLVRRVAAEIRRDAELKRVWYPVVFGEESYRVGSAGEFWLEALFHVAEQTGESRWKRSYEELEKEADQERLRGRALGQLLDLADLLGKRLLLVVENLQEIFRHQLGPDEDWSLRHTFQGERRIMLLGTVTTRFEAIEDENRAWFEMLATYELEPLDEQECARLWESVTGETVSAQRVRPMRILSGGSPRLLTILARFAKSRSFRELMDRLVELIDDHTEYFRSRLESLPPQERRVFAALLERWDAASAAELAKLTRLTASQVSAHLRRLEERGAVEVVENKPRRKLYQAAERLFNIYYLMRRRGRPYARVRLAVDFMVLFYEGEELAAATADLAREARGLGAAERREHFIAYQQIYARTGEPSLQRRIYEATPPEFFEAPDLPESLQAPVLEAERLRREAHDAAVAGELREVTGPLEKLRSLWNADRGSADLGARFAMALISGTYAFGNAGRLDRVEELLGELRKLTEAHGAGGQIALAHAQGLVNALNAFGNAGRLERVEQLLGELRGVAAANEGEAEIALEHANGLFNAAVSAELAGQRDRANGCWSRMLEVFREVLDCAELGDVERREILFGLIGAAAAGYGRQVLKVVTGSKAAEALETLGVGIRIDLGEEPRVAREILEVARDVAKRIAAAREQMREARDGTMLG